MARVHPNPGVKPFTTHHTVRTDVRHHARYYGLHLPLDRGWGVDRGPAPKTNAKLRNQLGEEIRFHVTELEASFGMSGSTAQSKNLRQFFPFTLDQPKVMIRGQCPDSHRYNLLAAFVRSSHLLAQRGRSARILGIPYRNITVTRNKGKKNEFKESHLLPTIKLYVYGQNTGYENPNNEKKLNRHKDGRVINRSTKGGHRTWALEGYVNAISAGGKAHDHAPEFEFEFVVFASYTKYGIFHDQIDLGSRTLSWADFKKNTSNLVSDPTPPYTLRRPPNEPFDPDDPTSARPS